MAEQRSKKTEENKHGALIAGCSAERETLHWDIKPKSELTSVYLRYANPLFIRRALAVSSQIQVSSVIARQTKWYQVIVELNY